MPNCLINGHKIHYHFLNANLISEKKPTLVFLHEGLGSIMQWKDFPDEISSKLELPALVYDRYGYGKSEKLKEKRNSNFMYNEGAVELPALLKELKIDGPLVVIGHSDGATIALAFASQFSQQVKAVISEAAHVMLEDISRSGIRNTIKLFKETKLREFLERYHGNRTESMFYGWAETWISEEMDGWDLKEQLSLITSPVLSIQGENDEYGSPEQLNWIAKYCKGPVEQMLIPDCGHIPHFQARELVAEAMITFIKKNI
jgi:pimeloyl-ACP methyl ester carboxylesterase